MMQNAWLSPPQLPHPESSPKASIDAETHRKRKHISHCYDYLLQAIMCAADPALEGRSGDSGWDMSETDGWGTVHRCGDWGGLRGYAVENGAEFGGHHV